MIFRECNVCHGNYDDGELVGGICDECREEMSSKNRRKKEMDCMVRSVDFKQ